MLTQCHIVAPQVFTYSLNRSNKQAITNKPLGNLGAFNSKHINLDDITMFYTWLAMKQVHEL